MAILTFNNLSQSFGAEDIFTGLSGAVEHGARIGLIGANGIGKTTLLRLLAGLDQPTAGEIFVARGIRLGYLRQEAAQALAGHDHSVFQEMLTVFAPLRQQEATLRAMEAGLATGDEALIARYGEQQERFERAGGYDYELRIQQTLDGLGFGQADWHSPLAHLSGGQMTRALLARLLLERPDLLILDEPTNHLDIGAVEWLEQMLRQWEGALLVVSHDRYFLDKAANRIWEMGPSHIESYRGGYRQYTEQREARWLQQQQLYEAEMARLHKELAFVRKHIAGQNTDIAKGKLKRLTRDVVAIEELGWGAAQGAKWSEISAELDKRVRPLPVGEVAERLGQLRPPLTRPPHLAMRLLPPGRSGEVVLKSEGLVVGYPGTRLFAADDISLLRGECAALIGPNGAGKSTFLRTVLGELPSLAGHATLGLNLQVAYFAQAHEGLDRDDTVLQALRRQAPALQEGQARDLLAQYLFRGDDVWKRVDALSGGERGRLALAILAQQGANLLLLDEPTNHLDIPSQEVLEEALNRFPGTILLVSHDRYLVAELATQVWEVAGGRLTVFPGRYDELMARRNAENAAQREVKSSEMSAADPSEGAAPAALSKGEIQRRQWRLNELEQEIEAVEGALTLQSAALQRSTEQGDVEALRRHSDDYAATEARLETLMAEWGTIVEELGG